MKPVEFQMVLNNITQQTDYYVNVSDWGKWDNNAQSIYDWLNANTVLGNKGCFGTRIYFQTEKELVWFKLIWGDNL